MMTQLRRSLRIVEKEPGGTFVSNSGTVSQRTEPVLARELPRSVDSIGSIAADLALALTAAEWERIKDSGDVARLLRFAAYFPGYYSELAYDLVHAIQSDQREHSNWLWAEDQGTSAAYLRYLAAWPQGRNASAAHNRLLMLGFSDPDEPRLNVSSIRRGSALGGDEQNQQVAGNAGYGLTGGTNGSPEMQGLVFQDSLVAPELVVVPAGTFVMGADDDNGRPFERPNRAVTIPHQIAVGRFPITFDDWSQAVRTGAITYQPDDEGWGRGCRPLINVSWHDAQLYIAWLSKVTGFQYRLLSEAEWEYCCRAGSQDVYSTGNIITPVQARFSVKEWGASGQTSETGSFAPNSFGLYDMHGNVAEWVEDDWVASYGVVGTDGAAVKSQLGAAKIARGGGWPDLAAALRSACRNRLNPKTRNNSTGFRVARSLV